MAKRIYLTEDSTGAQRLINATTASTAMAHHALNTISVRVATQIDLVGLIGKGIQVEEAGAVAATAPAASPEPEPAPAHEPHAEPDAERQDDPAPELTASADPTPDESF